MYKVHTKPNQTRTPQLPPDIRKTNKRVSFSTGVIPTTSFSTPQLKSNQLGDRVMHNNNQWKKQQVEDHRRNFKFSNNKTSITACNDSLNAKTSNVNFVCVTCGKCVLNDNHDITQITVNQSAATPLKRTVAAESTNQKPRSTIRKQYEQIRTKSRTTNISKPTTLRKFTVSNTPSSSNSFAARRDNFIHRRLWVLKAHDGKSQASKNVTIKRVYYVEGLNHNLFSVGQLCDADLEVAFRNSTCYIRDLKGNDLLTGSHGTDMYFIILQDTSTPNPTCLMAKVSSS
ncbi:hypothetical protein Tco_1186302 [Tanacetum coccineum]